MNLRGLSTNGLLKLHTAIREALDADDSTPPGGEKAFGVREYPDWRLLANGLESVLDERGTDYIWVPW